MSQRIACALAAAEAAIIKPTTEMHFASIG
jgi:hypothetical protein